MAGFSIFETLHVEVNCLFVAPLNSEVVPFFKFAKKSKKKKKTMIITPESFQVAASMQLVSFVNML